MPEQVAAMDDAATMEAMMRIAQARKWARDKGDAALDARLKRDFDLVLQRRKELIRQGGVRNPPSPPEQPEAHLRGGDLNRTDPSAAGGSTRSPTATRPSPSRSEGEAVDPQLRISMTRSCTPVMPSPVRSEGHVDIEGGDVLGPRELDG
jgi:hypothetical protein